MDSRSQCRARADPADVLRRIDIEDKWWRIEQFMLAAVREFPVRA